MGKIKTYNSTPQKEINIAKNTAGLKCRSQVTGQVTGYSHRSQVRSQVRLQATAHRSQATGQVTGHTKNNRTLDKTVLD